MAWHHRLLNLFHRAELSQAIDDELQFHIDERVDVLEAAVALTVCETAPALRPAEDRRT